MATRDTDLPLSMRFGFLPNEDLYQYAAQVRASHFLREGRVTEDQALFILNRATEILSAEPNVLHLNTPVNVCGDIHGQYYDLHQLLLLGGSPEKNSYLFLGDYVDRGSFSIECVLSLWALKICHPTTFFLLRGNHECQYLTTYFTFKLECERKYSSRVYDACIRSFCALPLAAIVDGRYFCVHGGLSPQLGSPEDIMLIDRFREPPNHGLMCDLLWSDPHSSYDCRQFNHLFEDNATRGCSFLYTPLAVRQFLKQNNLMCIIRAHEHQNTGYRFHHDVQDRVPGGAVVPKLITIFSAPNYMDKYGNKAAFISLSPNAINVRCFVASSHPYWLPGFMNAFDWSAPFIAQKVKDMISLIFSCEEMQEYCCLRQRAGIIHKKVLAVGRLARIFAVIHGKTDNGDDVTAMIIADACMEGGVDESDCESRCDEDIDAIGSMNMCDEGVVYLS